MCHAIAFKCAGDRNCNHIWHYRATNGERSDSNTIKPSNFAKKHCDHRYDAPLCPTTNIHPAVTYTGSDENAYASGRAVNTDNPS